ncbi:hypothetical protein Tco_1397246, partial [Tanacetum coccineum]
LYGAILPQHLTNQAMLEFEAYKTYRAYVTGEKTSKPKSTKKKANSESSTKTKPTQASKGKRIKTSAKGDIPAKKKQSATKSKSLTVLFEVALTKAEHMKIALEKSKTQQHSSHVSGSGADEGTGVTPGVLDVPSYDSEAELISWNSSDEEDGDEVNMGDDNDDDADNQDNDGQEYDEQHDDNQDDDDQEHDDQDDEEQDDVNEKTDSDNDGDDFVHPKLSTYDEEYKEEGDSDPRIHTPSNYESIDDEEIQGANVEGEEIDEEEINEKDEANELYRDINVNLEGRDTGMTDAPRTIIQTTQVIEDTHVIITPVNPEVQQSSSVSSSFVSNMLNPSPDIDFINKLDDNIKKIIKDQVKAQVSKILQKIEKTVNEQLEVEVLTRSSNESKTSHAVATNLSELELKKILINKMESNKSIHRSDEQKNLYKALVDAYESNKVILDTYGESVSFKRRRDEEDKDEEPSTGSNQGSKRRRAGKEPESTSALKEKTSKTTGKSTEGSKSHQKSVDESAQAEEPMQTAKDLEELAHQEFEAGVTEDQPDEETSQLPDWFQKPAKPPTPDRDWNKTLPDAHRPVLPWLSSLAQMEDLLYKTTTDQLDWNNPEGQQYPHDLQKPLPLIPNSRGRRVIPFDHFINKTCVNKWWCLKRTYTTSVGRRPMAANYGHFNGLKFGPLITMGIHVPISYDKHTHMGGSHIGGENDNNSIDLLLTGNLLKIDDDKLYTFKEGNFNRLHIQDIEYMLLVLVQGKLTNLTIEERLAFNVSLRIFTRSVVIQRRVEDLQLGVEIY